MLRTLTGFACSVRVPFSRRDSWYSLKVPSGTLNTSAQASSFIVRIPLYPRLFSHRHRSISSDAQIPRSTVQEYFRILKDTLLAQEVPVWRKGCSRKTVETAKFYLFDTGITRHLQGRKPLVRGTPEYGHAFESWIMHEIASYSDAFRRDAEIAYWRTRTNLEVDFVVNDDVAIEAKTTRNATKDDLKGLRAIDDEGTFRHRILVSDEPRPREVDGISILPWRNFIDRLWSGDLF